VALFEGSAFAQSAAPAPADEGAKVNGEGAKATNAGTPGAKDDGWPDLSSFLDQKFGFLPVAMPITEPAVGYGAAGGLGFLSKPLGDAAKGLGRPNITFVGGMGTENGSWGMFAADSRYWLDDRVQTLAGFVHASVKLDFHGIGHDSKLQDHPIRYTLEPTAGAAIGKYRLGMSRWWVGIGYAFAHTKVTVDSPAELSNLPDQESTSNTAALLPSLVFDDRDTIFTPTRGTYLEASVNVAGKWLGGDDNFARPGFTVLQYVPLPHDFYFAVRTEGRAAFGDAPFYMLPYISLRGVPVMRYQGEETLVLEAELRWQFYKRFSLVAFGGAGNAWNDFEKLDNSQGVGAGGGGFRYELARKYGIHMGVDVAFSPDATAFYIQVGSAWMRP
jgi:outer membrane protein assembly factor BamA